MNRLGAVLRSQHNVEAGVVSLSYLQMLANQSRNRTKSALRAAARRAGKPRWASNESTTVQASEEPVQKTPLHLVHEAHGARMMPFAGYNMPLQYADASIISSHTFTRKHASLFDVSHMVPHAFRGPDAAAFLERITPSAIASMEPLQSKLTALLWPDTGGIVDDAMVTYLGDDVYYVVTNGACRVKDTKYLDDELAKFEGEVEWTRLDGSGLVALQGPQAAEVLRLSLASNIDLGSLYFGHAVWARLKLPPQGKSPRGKSPRGKSPPGKSPPVLVSRGGYTGEDGFELLFNAELYPVEFVKPAIEGILKRAGPDRVRLAGLGARDSLRLEAGLCLYGNDLTDSTTPVEAGLSWIIPPERRKAGGFHGADVIIPQLTPKSKGGTGVASRRVGLVVQGAPARHGAELQHQGRVVGKVTSGMPSPTLRQNIAMAYVEDGLHKLGTELDAVVRGKKYGATVTKMPFVPTQYRRPPQ